MALARIVKFCDFQAEYEGSIPFTRSKAPARHPALTRRQKSPAVNRALLKNSNLAQASAWRLPGFDHAVQ
jgi:hypothetical protein